ncbi:PAS domain-containing protein [Planosporangium sp. 12N6]|uniref:PAS domain-containing protein n=1 Tax=Planosporangium spinosum TaxID=3402278 RepID=UPI003CF27F2C
MITDRLLGAQRPLPGPVPQGIRRASVPQDSYRDSVPRGVYRVDRGGYCVYVNPAGAALLGWSAADLIGLAMHALIHHRRPDGSPYPWFECPVGETLRGGEAYRVDTDVMWRRDGTPLPVAYSCAPVIGADGIEGAVVRFAERGAQVEQVRSQAWPGF